MDKDKWDRMVERLKHTGAERVKALTKIKRLKHSEVPMLFDLKIDALLVAIIGDKMVPKNELHECLGVFLAILFTQEQKKSFVDEGILPALLPRCMLEHNGEDTVKFAIAALYNLRLCAYLSGPQWIAAGVHKRMFELLAVSTDIADRAMGILWTLTDHEVFANALNDTSFLVFLISLLNIGALKPEHFTSTTKQKKALSMLCNLAMWDGIRPSLIATGVVDTLSPLVKWEGYAGLRSTMGLACLVGSKEDKESKHLIAQPAVIERLIGLLDSTVKKQTSGYGTTFSVEEVLLTIQNLSISDHNKAMLGTPNTLSLLLGILADVTSSERSLQLASSSLLELSFSTDVMARLKSPELELVSVLEACALRVKGLPQHNVKQLLWALDDKAHSSTAALAPDAKKKTGHIMMSYSWAHQPTVVKLARALQKNGFTVWLDIDAMKGSTVDAMAQAVEDSALLIMTVSDKYKESANCRLEAQYALQLGKPIVFLMMQKDYRPSGWLGLLMGAKMWYDFTDNALFSDRLDAVRREIASYIASHCTTTATTATSADATIVGDASRSTPSRGPSTVSGSISFSAISPVSDKKVTAMTEDDVAAWLTKCSLSSLVECFRTHAMDGPALAMLWDICAHEGTHAAATWMRQDFGVTQMGVVLRFVHQLRALCAPPPDDAVGEAI